MKPRILIVDDEAPIRNMLAFSLNRAEMDVDVAADGDQALARLADSPHPDLIVLDWMMPGLDGLQLTRTLRDRDDYKDIPIILLTARGSERDRTQGLDSGADDYVVKPFSTRELISRVRAVLRRARPETAAADASTPSPTAPRLQVGALVLDPEQRRALAEGRPLNMGPTEYRLLRLFMQHPGRAWSRGQLLNELWGNDRAVEERTVDVHIRRLRKALEPTGHAGYVQTVRGHGYRFSDVV
ncbi:phosphate regulon transcriptional regulatory protein PhoB [Wenzhouxiangella sp. XN79A]|uniref:phosphate regulon transcriptional regulator PhoB n=1 Tax=Wenzhouxiangella sp. XN79A TaxID=2724193 RepID=UPI00144AA628|nr:phosphate regulon transcriptional regulator PhoB [Wenzhouxiangella sp. XN79A]NKI35930.1 phosphate regulon transcriptional regulatory protein PhoB [Wenzhouxiangella sp. XN79A]